MRPPLPAHVLQGARGCRVKVAAAAAAAAAGAAALTGAAAAATAAASAPPGSFCNTFQLFNTQTVWLRAHAVCRAGRARAQAVVLTPVSLCHLTGSFHFPLLSAADMWSPHRPRPWSAAVVPRCSLAPPRLRRHCGTSCKSPPKVRRRDLRRQPQITRPNACSSWRHITWMSAVRTCWHTSRAWIISRRSGWKTQLGHGADRTCKLGRLSCEAGVCISRLSLRRTCWRCSRRACTPSSRLISTLE